MAAFVPAANSKQILIMNAVLLIKSPMRETNIVNPVATANVNPTSVHGNNAFASACNRTSNRKSTIHIVPNTNAIATICVTSSVG